MGNTQLDPKQFGEKLRNHRKQLGMTQESAAEKIGVSAQAISKWEAGDCLPDCFNLKAISDLYGISADVLLDTQTSGNLSSVASKIEQLGTEFVWANANTPQYQSNLRKELGKDLWEMWKGLYFTEVGDKTLQKASKARGNLRITGAFGAKIWDDDGIACVIQSDLIHRLPSPNPLTSEVLSALCTPQGQALICALSCDRPKPKQKLAEETGIPTANLNELLLLFTENRVLEYIAENQPERCGYLISGHCGIAAYMVVCAAYLLQKRTYEVSQFVSEE